MRLRRKRVKGVDIRMNKKRKTEEEKVRGWGLKWKGRGWIKVNKKRKARKMEIRKIINKRIEKREENMTEEDWQKK